MEAEVPAGPETSRPAIVGLEQIHRWHVCVALAPKLMAIYVGARLVALPLGVAP